MEKVKNFGGIAKKIGVRSCVIFFIVAIIFNILLYTRLTSQFNEVFSNKEKLIAEYGEQEANIENQIEVMKSEKGKDFPVVAMLEYTQYIVGTTTTILINLQLAMYSVALAVIIEVFSQFIKFVKKSNRNARGAKNGE